jgi:hypothetical protein
MAACSRCGGLFFNKGVRVGKRRFCSELCAEKGRAIAVADDLPSERVLQLAKEFFEGECPRCHRMGRGVDIRRHHRLVSAYIVEKRSTNQSVCCRSCGAKDQLGSLGYTFALGWWSHRGIILTPVWIGKNVVELVRTARRQPSRELKTLLAQDEAKKLIDQEIARSPDQNHLGS